jgi:hypothetical protein
MRAAGAGQEGFAAKGRGNDLRKERSVGAAREPRPRINAHLGHYSVVFLVAGALYYSL